MSEDVPILRVNDQPVAARPGQVVLEALQSAGLLVQSACSGRGACALCQVTVVGGKASAPTALEGRAIARVQRHQGLRLACQMRLVASVALTVPTLGAPDAQRG